MKSKKPHKKAKWNEERGTWQLGQLWYLPENMVFSPWCWFNWEENRVIAECLNPDAKIALETYVTPTFISMDDDGKLKSSIEIVNNKLNKK